MGKQTSAYDLVLAERRREIPAYRWLYEEVRSQILSGRLIAGARLPATRDLCGRYGLSRGTIVNAFDQLRSEGYIEGVRGSGTYVSKMLPDNLLQVAPGKAQRSTVSFNGIKSAPTISNYGRRARLFECYEDKAVRAFRANLPALNLFPITLWSKITSRCIRRVSTRQLMGCSSLGYMPLRKEIAEYLSLSRGVACVPEQVSIVSGVQEALDLSARVLLNPDDRVAVENPGYPGAAAVFQAAGAKIVRASVDDQGLVVRDLPARHIHLVYVTPGHQFPLGITMSLTRRLQLLRWAQKSGGLIFEDDYDSEYRYAGRPVPALQGLDASGLVLYAGSFSKVMFPSLRLGYLVIPPRLVDRFAAIQSLSSRHAPLLQQLAMTEFIGEGHFGRHLQRMREIYAERLTVLLEAAQKRLEGLLDISPIDAGLQTVGWLCAGIDGESAAAAAAERNVDVTPLSRYSHGTAGPEGLQLGFAGIDTREIRSGVCELALSLEGLYKACVRSR